MTDWFDNLKFFNETEGLHNVVSLLYKEYEEGLSILPETNNILNALHLTPLNSVKVVILGQDPYPTKGHANGLAFSVHPNVKPIPRSLQNIYKELVDDIGCDTPQNGDLTQWAQQGVLLLNTSLTVIEGNPGSHANIGWNPLIIEIIETINKLKNNVVFILWGKFAQRKGAYIHKSRHHVISSPHPSPLSADRGFFGSTPFSKTNKYLTSKDIKPIDWNLSSF